MAAQVVFVNLVTVGCVACCPHNSVVYLADSRGERV